MTLTDADRHSIDSLVARLEAAWNAGDGEAFAAPFAPDADFVNVRAEHHQGRQAIA
ncbi:MAG: SgcJ/EcaC family oxidoreductase, partial [Vicinamibacterales bacterium]